MLDLDHFKNVNDSMGHAIGDRLLVAAAQRLASLVRGGDMAGRLGGDEFVVVMRDLDDPTEAARVGERVVAGFREALPVGELALITTASVGLSVAMPGDGGAPAPSRVVPARGRHRPLPGEGRRSRRARLLQRRPPGRGG